MCQSLLGNYVKKPSMSYASLRFDRRGPAEKGLKRLWEAYEVLKKLGPADAAVTMTEYASITCPHCAAFNENVFPKIKAAYIDTGKIRYVFHEFPLDPVAAASSVLSRCIAKGDSEKYFAVTDLLFKQPWAKVTKPRETLNLVGKQAGLDEQQVGACLKDDVLFTKIVAERIAAAKLGVNATPTFLVNDEKIVGMTPFEEFDRRFKALLKI